MSHNPHKHTLLMASKPATMTWAKNVVTMADRLPDSITPIDTLSLQERVYHELRRLIVTGTLEPGSALTIRSVAESLGTSVMPVREAIQRLTANQALELRANKSIRVPAVSKPQFLELSDIRRAVQGLAAEMAARHASDADIDALVEQVADAASIGETADIGALLELNYAFHQAICRCAKSTWRAHGRCLAQTGPDLPEEHRKSVSVRGQENARHWHPAVSPSNS